MRKLYFFTQFSPPPVQLDVGSGEIVVERSGYVDAKTRIENMILAGQRLIEARNAEYDFDGDVDDEFTDPTRSVGYELADAHQDRLRAEANLKASQERLKASQKAAKDAADALVAAKAKEASGGASEQSETK